MKILIYYSVYILKFNKIFCEKDRERDIRI